MQQLEPSRIHKANLTSLKKQNYYSSNHQEYTKLTYHPSKTVLLSALTIKNTQSQSNIPQKQYYCSSNHEDYTKLT